MHMLSKATIEALWRDNDVPINDLDEIDDGFCGWERLTDREEIWRWFDEQYARWGGVHALMFPDEHPEARDGASLAAHAGDMGDYNSGALPDPCYRMDTGDGARWRSIEFGDGTGYVRLDIARRYRWADDGLDPRREYVVGTFEPCDVEERVEPEVLYYIEDNGLMNEIVLGTVKHLRDAYDRDFGDTVGECLRSALIDEIGREKLEELES